MANDRPQPDRDRLLAARLTGIAQRNARWGALTDDEKTARAAELREVADGRADLLAETAGLALGTTEGKGEEYRAQGQAIAELCRMAGADEDLIPAWTLEGQRRATAVQKRPFSRPPSGGNAARPETYRSSAQQPRRESPTGPRPAPPP